MPTTSKPSNRKRLPPSTIRRRNMQRRKRIRPPNLPLKNPLSQSHLTNGAKSAPVISARDIPTEIHRLGQQPNRAISPVSVAQDGLGDPPPAENVVEGGEGERKEFLVRKWELEVLGDEEPEGGCC